MEKRSTLFCMDAQIDWEILEGGIKRKILAYDAHLMMVRVQFEAGAIGYEHTHPHTQTVYCLSGKFEYMIGDEKRTLGQGDTVLVPSGILHGAVCIEPGEMIDVFTPMRDDFLAP